MTLETLKQQIQNKIDIDRSIIFKYSDTDFIPHQYVREMIKYMNAELVLVENVSSFYNKPVFTNNSIIFLYKVDTFSDVSIDLLNNKNLIIFCKKISKEAENKYGEFIIDIPKIERIFMDDYVYCSCPTIYDKIRNLPDICKNNMYLLENELSKVSIFSPNVMTVSTSTADDKLVPEFVLTSIFEAGLWNHLTSSTYIFDLIQAVLTKNISLVDYLLSKDTNVEPAAFFQLIFNQVCDIIKVVADPQSSAVKAGMSNGKYWAIKNLYSFIWNKNSLSYILYVLTDLEIKLKSGEIKYDRELIYIIIIEIMRSN